MKAEKREFEKLNDIPIIYSSELFPRKSGIFL